jgi:hypothetical protein
MTMPYGQRRVFWQRSIGAGEQTKVKDAAAARLCLFCMSTRTA